eukprot:gb/GECH01011478.1/.p1 GENE.gb/GECH01011478.1/~~gb/GECH01011478.1/.p1  ORF type:complete len:195 (+),score=61.12 gb/GECH01011478.1/:1-585(+)
MEDAIFQLKFTGKQFERSAKRCKKDEKKEKNKVKKAIEQGNIDGARIYSQNAIRKKNEYLNYLRLSSRLDAVSSRLQTASQMNQVTKSMGGVVKGMDKVLQTMDPEKISKVMEKFENQFEDVDVLSSTVQDSMASSTSQSTPENEVNDLMAQVADEHSLDISGSVGVGKGDLDKSSEVQADELSQRLNRLKSSN